jgi:hypothetical protein
MTLTITPEGPICNPEILISFEGRGPGDMPSHVQASTGGFLSFPVVDNSGATQFDWMFSNQDGLLVVFLFNLSFLLSF